jgi:hypothetical protein
MSTTTICSEAEMLSRFNQLTVDEKLAKAEIIRLNRESQLLPERIRQAHQHHDFLLKQKAELRRELGLLP